MNDTVVNVFKGQVNEATALAKLLEVSTIVVQQAVDLVDGSLTSDEQLTVQSRYMPGSTIGKHLRHARDHFVLLLDCLSSSSPHVLNYDIRSRNTPMESSRQAARESLLAVIEQLTTVVPEAKLDDSITLQAITPYPQVVQTTFGRELWFAGLHAIHHWSMVRVIAGEMGIKLADSFGFAPSTLVHNANGSLNGEPKT
ncbi:hypothetical protein POSPLADRAFT_1127479 [Postia placenta MAD-698-R-SB12]|uniref:DinB-like domain-containing protein n=1 Tax=Postia placenta MAD-698-R-SB12 TaxID=670580 RepID=A0A1X6NGM4_9APHY|nr:hypothetical protein POSPLADRAFT_1127479 [Postia placenta MAD-698-R-SB12]OSX67785.1 hypothetical protein POSPLADRAFT_1127479 [Postia placenta MAD-698-R-SB12]